MLTRVASLESGHPDHLYMTDSQSHEQLENNVDNANSTGRVMPILELKFQDSATLLQVERSKTWQVVDSASRSPEPDRGDVKQYHVRGLEEGLRTKGCLSVYRVQVY